MDELQVVFENNTASISATATDPEDGELQLPLIPIQNNLNCKTDILAAPFTIDHDDNIKLEIFVRDNNNYTVSKLSTMVGNINANLYTRGRLSEDELLEDEPE